MAELTPTTPLELLQAATIEQLQKELSEIQSRHDHTCIRYQSELATLAESCLSLEGDADKKQDEIEDQASRAMRVIKTLTLQTQELERRNKENMDYIEDLRKQIRTAVQETKKARFDLQEKSEIINRICDVLEID